jgi:Ribonuclease G/E
VVTADGKLERLIVEREGEGPRARVGEVWRGRVRATPRGFRGAFVDLGLERDGLMKLDAASGAVAEGAIVEAEVASEGRDDKGPALRFLGRGSGSAGRLAAAPPLETRLRNFAQTADIETGEAARDLADRAEEVVLARICRVAPELVLTLDQARGMTAVDVDFTDPRASRKAVADANCLALYETARLARLKSLGGLIVVDLVGQAREHALLIAAAREAFAPDDPGVVLAGVSRLGVFEIAKPWRERPVAEDLCDREGRLSARSVAQRLIRALEREGRADPGGRITGRCAPEVAAEARRFVGELGPRYAVDGEPGCDRQSFDVSSV